MILANHGIVSSSGGLPPSTLLTNLYAVYKAESNANDSLGVYNGTAQGGLTYSTGKSNNAFTFNGSNAYVSLPNNSLNFTGDFSFSLWMNRKFAVVANILTNWYNGATPFGWWLSINNGTIAFKIGNGTSSLICNTSITLGDANIWQNIVVTKTATQVKIYIDNILRVTGSVTGTIAYTITHYPIIGAVKYDSSSPSGFLENGCLIDELNIWNKELTTTEITELYNSGSGKFYPF